MPFLLQNRFLCSKQERTCFKGGTLSIWHRYGKQLFCCNFLLIKILSPEGRTESPETQERDIPHKSQKDETYEIHNASFGCYLSKRTAGKRRLSGLTSEFPVWVAGSFRNRVFLRIHPGWIDSVGNTTAIELFKLLKEPLPCNASFQERLSMLLSTY